MSYINIKGITHKYNSEGTALKDINIEIENGEFFSLLGPSGCGKSTLLNIIGGFLTPSIGTIEAAGKDITHLAPYQREIGMVFQSYALFPHLSVFENVAYGLRVKKMLAKEIQERVYECLELVHLREFEKRMPHQLSGGQQQRVAIARALAIRPSILMLDEPLGNLDAKLRKEMQIELRSIQKRVGITTIMVTHDQEEAMSMSDRICILKNGCVQQVGTPMEVYRRPANSFVADFLGQVNLTDAKPVHWDSYLFHSVEWIQEDGEPIVLQSTKDGILEKENQIKFMIRPERMQVSFETGKKEVNSADVTIKNITYVGNSVYLIVAFGKSGEIKLNIPDPFFVTPPEIGDKLHLSWNASDLIHVLEERR